MCGFMVYRENGDNSRIALRGRDLTRTERVNGLTFVHNLLWVTGDLTPQPYIDGDVVCLYNGEVYNQKFSRSDGEVLIPLYRQHGPTFARHLDGEFAVALYDFGRDIAVFSTDPFGTKPIFVNGIECSSYRSGVGGDRLAANRVRVVRLSDGSTVEENDLHGWAFDRQTVGDYDSWIRSFDAAVAKRAVPGCFLGLSAGYDSGAIACSLLKAGVPFKAFVFQGKEDRVVLEARLSRLSRYEWFEPDPMVKRHLTQLYAAADNEKYTIHYDGKETSMRLLDDGGIYGVATYSKLASEEGRKVCLSGQGGDEILSDYSLYPSQSEFRGRFPSALSRWRNFDRGCQESYLMKEEYAGGAYSIETRYPFLDRTLVQDFLNLAPALKNSRYKAPLHEYLVRNGFPFQPGVKTGFCVEL